MCKVDSLQLIDQSIKIGGTAHQILIDGYKLQGRHVGLLFQLRFVHLLSSLNIGTEGGHI